MFGPFVLVLALGLAAFFLWVDRNGRRYHKD